MAKAFKASRLIGLSVLALSAMVFSSSAAQAELNAKWQVTGSDVTNELKAQLQVTEIETLSATGKKEVILLTKSGLTTVEILCTEMKFLDALLEVLGAATGRAHFGSCTTKLKKEPPAAACVPHSPGDPSGLIQTNALVSLIKLQSGFEVLEVKPTVGVTWVVLQFGIGECSIGNNIEITGVVFLKAGTEKEGKEATVQKLFSEHSSTVLLFGSNKALFDGSAKAALVTPHSGMVWSGKAG